MKCPHCDYDATSSNDGFYNLEVENDNSLTIWGKMKDWDDREKELVGCPKCNKVFMA